MGEITIKLSFDDNSNVVVSEPTKSKTLLNTKKEYLTVKDVARKITRSTSFVLKDINNENLIATKEGKSYKITAEDAEEYHQYLLNKHVY